MTSTFLQRHGRSRGPIRDRAPSGHLGRISQSAGGSLLRSRWSRRQHHRVGADYLGVGSPYQSKLDVLMGLDIGSVSGLLDQFGGLDGITKKLQDSGLDEIAGKLGLDSDDLASKISEFLPDAVDKATPDGVGLVAGLLGV